MTSKNQVKTVFDVKAYALLRNLYQNDTLIEPESQTWQKAHLLAERDGYLEQLLVQKYLRDNRIDLKIQEEDWRPKAQVLHQQWLEAEKANPDIQQWGIDKARVYHWTEDRHALEKFLQTHRPFQPIVTTRKIQEHYEENKSDKYLDQPLESIRNVVEADYKQSFLKQEFQRWIRQELRRQKWKLYPIGPAA